MKKSSVHYSELTGSIRIYEGEDGYENRDDYEGIVSVLWLTDTRVMLFGANGKIDKRALLSIFATLHKRGAKEIDLTRATGRRMPFATLVEEFARESLWRIDLDDLYNRGIFKCSQVTES